MRDVSVDPEARLAHVGPGCLLKHVDLATQEHGLATVLGFVSETGVAGLTLGGGWGYLTRRFGWTVDNLEEVEIVTADGEVRTANRDENADLFWTVRGGGGNFGVVTRFTFRLNEVGPTVTGGLIAWSGERAEEVLSTYRELTESAPRELTAAAVVGTAGPVHSRGVARKAHRGDTDLPQRRGRRDGPRRSARTRRADRRRHRTEAIHGSTAMLDAMGPKGVHRYWKTEFLPGLSSESLDTFREGALKVRSPLSQSVIFDLGGALNEREDDDGAVGNRDVRYISGFAGTWPPGTPAEPHVAWVRGAWEAIRPFSTGGNYVNFQLAEDDATRTADAYGDNYERLRRVKAEYDPDNLFRVNRNIPPVA
jgi:FAD/FMN-containing dehydrogenase